jgi:hypothetical protein
MLLVTHSAEAVERWCDEAVWLDRGVIRAAGEPRKVIDLYRQEMSEQESHSLARSYDERPPAEPAASPAEALDRWGTREIEIERVRLDDAYGHERYVYTSGEPVTIRFTYRVHRPVESHVFGFAILRNDGLWVYGTNTDLSEVSVPELRATGLVEVTIDALDLTAGSYFVDVAAHAHDGTPYDYHSRRYPFSVRDESGDHGVTKIHHRWRIAPA